MLGRDLLPGYRLTPFLAQLSAHFLRTMRIRSTLLLGLLPIALVAQMRHGPRVGLAVATRTGGQFLQWTGLPKFGPILGWSFDVPYTYQVGFRIEPTLMSKGSWTRNDLLNQNTRITDRYLELPVLIRLDLDTVKGGFFLTGGPIYGYWLSTRSVVKQGGEILQEQKIDLSAANFNRSEWSVAVGLGQQGEKWSWEVRGQTSVTPFNSLFRSQNLVFGIHLTYWLPLPEKPKKEEDEDTGTEP